MVLDCNYRPAIKGPPKFSKHPPYCNSGELPRESAPAKLFSISCIFMDAIQQQPKSPQTRRCPMPNIDTLFWDIGGVVLTNGWDRGSRKAAAENFPSRL